jgi:hypothetical protein
MSCSGGKAIRATPSENERPPIWHVVLNQGIVGSDTAVPTAG